MTEYRELKPGWYRVKHGDYYLFREKRENDNHFYNQRGYKQFYVQDYDVIDRVFFVPLKRGVKYV